MKKKLYKEKLELQEVFLDNEVPFTVVECPSCKTKVPADNLDLGKGVAKCSGCHVIFPFQQTIEAITAIPDGLKEEVLQPEGIEIFEYRNELEFVVDQYTTGLDIAGLIILPILFFIMVGIYAEEGGSAWLPIGSAVITFWFYWKSFTRKRNKIFININQDTIDIQWRPKLLQKDKSFARESIKQLYVKEDGLFMIVDELGEKKHVKLFSQLLNKAKANYIERKIENYLGIVDVKYGS